MHSINTAIVSIIIDPINDPPDPFPIQTVVVSNKIVILDLNGIDVDGDLITSGYIVTTSKYGHLYQVHSNGSIYGEELGVNNTNRNIVDLPIRIAYLYDNIQNPYLTNPLSPTSGND